MTYRFSDTDFAHAVQTSHSIAEVLRKLGMCGTGGAYLTFKTRAKKLGIDTSHFMGQGHAKGKSKGPGKRIPLSELLIKDSNRKITTKDKKRMFDEGLLINTCSECGIQGTWNNKPIVLHLDHINGEHLDNRIENLRILCPNCHSQTETFGGKNKVTYEKEPRPEYKPVIRPACLWCKTIIVKTNIAEYCGECWKQYRAEIRAIKGIKNVIKTKIEWPSNDELIALLEKSNYSKLGKELGVSDNAIRKRLRKK